MNVNLTIDRDPFCCPICCNEFNLDSYQPLCISCGHTLCKECVDKLSVNSIITCPIDKKKINLTTGNNSLKNRFDNTIVIKLLRLMDCPYIDYKIFTQFTFYYCENCKEFISNFTYSVHDYANHRVLSFETAKFTLIEEFKNITLTNNIKTIAEEEICLINLFVVLNYFHSPDVFRNYSLYDPKVFRNEHYYDTNYSFIGTKIQNVNKEINQNDDLLIFTKFIFSSPDKPKCTFKKGIYISKNNEVIHGIFLFDSENNITKALGVFKDSPNTINFFGLIHIKRATSGYEISLSYGISISEDGKFYFGKFKDDVIFPMYSHIYGEETNLITKCSYRKMIDFVWINKVFEESLFKNFFFSITPNSISFSKSILDKDKFNDVVYSLTFYSRNIIYEKSDFTGNDIKDKLLKEKNSTIWTDFEQIEFESVLIKNILKHREPGQDEFRIDPVKSEKSILEVNLESTYITFLKQFACMTSLKFASDFSFILSPCFQLLKSRTYDYSGYLFTLKDKYKILLESVEERDIKEINFIKKFFDLKKLKIKSIYENLQTLIEILENFLQQSPKYFTVYYQDFNIDTDEQLPTNYYTIDCEEGSITLHEAKTNQEKSSQSEIIKNLKIIQLFPNIFKKELQEALTQVKESITASDDKQVPNSARTDNGQDKKKENINLSSLNNTACKLNQASNINYLQKKKTNTTCKCIIY